MKNRQQSSIIIILVTILAAIGSYQYGIWKRAQFEDERTVVTQSPATPVVSETTLVTRVIDGDTIQIASGELVRYIGIDTPEVGRGNTPEECYAKEATEENKKLVLGKYITLVNDEADRDPYGRLLRYAYIGDIMINQELVAQGMAIARAYPPNTKHQAQLRESEENAKAEQRGLWQACSDKKAP